MRDKAADERDGTGQDRNPRDRTTRSGDAYGTTTRLFVEAELRAGAEIIASREQAHYLRTVLRRASGDAVRLFNGADGEWLGRVVPLGRDRLSLRLEARTRRQQTETGPFLLFALLKRDATDLVVRQAVELGCSRIQPVITERTNAARVNLDRLRAIAIEAAEQSERLTIPTVEPLLRLDAVLAGWPADRRLFVALERSQPASPAPDTISVSAGPSPAGPSSAAAVLAGAELAGLLVGPEGGWTPAEREWLRGLAFVTPISLGPFVLRAETAATAGLALLLGMGWAEYVSLI